MTLLISVTTPPLSREQAESFSRLLSETVVPEPLAIMENAIEDGATAWTVTALYDEEPACDRFEAAATATGFSASTLIIETETDRDWVSLTQQGLKPIEAGRFLVYGGHDKDRIAFGGIKLQIDAATAFGTGHHGTTLGCLQALDRILRFDQPARVLDIGCGSGLLAIAAARATKALTIASDIDPLAVHVTRTNASINQAGPLLRTATAAGASHPLIAANAPYDLVFANILARPLVSLAGGIVRLARKNGLIVLSGLTVDQAQYVTAAYRNRGALLHFHIELDGWMTLVLRAPGSTRTLAQT